MCPYCGSATCKLTMNDFINTPRQAKTKIMSLQISHGAWNGPYSTFNDWRRAISIAAGYPDLFLMEGFYDAESNNPRQNPFCHLKEWDKEPIATMITSLPIKWEIIRMDPLTQLLNHSDCSGYLHTRTCWPIAKRLTEILPDMPDRIFSGGTLKSVTQKFIDALMLAHNNKEKITFS